MSKWKQISIGDFVNFNPAESLIKGSSAKKIPMAMLSEFERKIKGYEYSIYKSGPKFRNGDTLVAKITPCLENGKTAQVDILEKDEVAFGSSEFIVLRENEHSINDYIFYLAKSPVFREKAISCMEGTSGRKRVSESALKRQEILVPSRNEQKTIASILSSLDDKIEKNRLINDNLEAMAKTIYDYWFVQFDFPDENGEPYKSTGGKMDYSKELKSELPCDWKIHTLDRILKLEYGKPLKESLRTGHGYPVLGSNGTVGFHDVFLVKGPGIVIGRKGSAGEVTWVDDNFHPIDTTYYVADCMGTERKIYHYYLLLSLSLKKLESSSAVPGLNRNSVHDFKVNNVPINLINQFHALVSPFFDQITSNKKQNLKLAQLRDWLLPMLMNGQVKIEDQIQEKV